MILDEHIFYPEHIAAEVLVSKIKAVLSQSDEPLWSDPRLDLENFIHRVCWNYGVHPIWVLVCLQREQSLIANNRTPADERAWSRATGVVGQHTPGQANKLWDGLCNQILLCARSSAWLAGIGPNEMFGYRPGLWPMAKRWTEADRAAKAKRIELLHDDGSFHKFYNCKSAAEYLQYAYTPTESVLTKNSDIMAIYVAPKFLG